MSASTSAMVAALIPASAAVAALAAAHGAARATHRAVVGDRLRGEPEASPVPAWFVAALAAADLDVAPDPVWRAARVGLGLGVLVLLATHPVAIGLAAGALTVTLALSPLVRRGREARALRADLPAGIESLVGSLSAGASLVQALDVASARPGPVGADLRTVVARHRRGVALQAALDRWAHDRPEVGVALVVDALALAGSTGGSRARALVAVGETLQARDALAREVRALGSQARASAAVLLVSPLAFAGAAALADRRVGALLVGRPLGWACLVGGLALDGIGAWWMARLVATVR